MRLFIATPIILDSYEEVKKLFQKCIEAKWVDKQNLHLTHLFIGEDEPNKYKNINLHIPKDKIVINGLGSFGNRILYLNVVNSSAKSINTKLQKILNIKKEFTPHITLCRIKYIKDMECFKKLVDNYKISFEAEYQVYLYQSILTQKGAIYKKIYEYK